jgi:hypothetical protein
VVSSIQPMPAAILSRGAALMIDMGRPARLIWDGSVTN